MNDLPKLRATNTHFKNHNEGGGASSKRPSNRLLIGALTLGIVTIVGTISYAYFTTTTTDTNQTATISTAKVNAVFTDADTGSNATLNFGESFTKKFTITNDGNTEAHVKMYWKDLVNTYTEQSLSYTLSKSATGAEGSYSEIPLKGTSTKSLVPRSEIESTILLAEDIEVSVGTTHYELKVTLNYLSDVNQDSDLTATFYSWFELEDINYQEASAIDKIIASSKGSLKVGDYDMPASTAESAGVYELVDEGNKTSYYFRGPVVNNYVRFGKWRDDEPDVYVGYISNNSNSMEFTTLEECNAHKIYNYNCTLLQRAGKPMYWRIIRVNGDGSLRMIYAGTQGYANDNQGADTFIKSGPFSRSAGDAKYVGYMYGPAGTAASTTKAQAQTNTESSNVKIILEEWYEKNLETKYGQYISKDAIFCNDRSITSGSGYGINYTTYGAFNRFYIRTSNGITAKTNILPVFKCSQNNDRFTSSGATTGNKALNHPIGLITADEIVAAGSGTAQAASDYYLKRNSPYFTFSPFWYNDNGGGGANIIVATRSGIQYNSTYKYNNIAPVINLTKEYASTLTQGDGTARNPYRA